MLEFPRILSQEGISPYDAIKWARRDITGQGFECLNAEFPETWNHDSCNIMAKKYFRQSRVNTEKETSVRQTFSRIVTAITKSGLEQGYFDASVASVFHAELTAVLLRQLALFNSPVLFNVGIPGLDKPLASACFINSVDDNMESILDLVKTEGLVFKEGAGSGVNFSKLRASSESIRGGGHASGPVSFLSIYDAAASVILSGGRTRRAAKMCILNADHPDIEAFISSKAKQEDLVQVLVEAGLSPKFDDPNGAYTVAKLQNENHSVRVTDTLMRKVREVLHGYKDDDTWDLINRADGTVAKTVSVAALFKGIAEAAHKSGDPGIQFHDTFNRYNTCSNDGEIISTNPCLTGNMVLKTASGYQRFDTLAAVGNAEIVSPTGEIATGKVWCTGEKQVIRIRFFPKTNMSDISCTPDHVWKLADGSVSRAEDLKGKRLMPEGNLRVFRGEKETLAGFIQGGGHTGRLSSKLHKGLEITFSAADYEIAQLFDTDIMIDGAKHYSNIAYDIAEEYSMDPRTLPERELPDLKDKDECAFLMGLYSANGCVLKNARVALKTTCVALRDQVMDLLAKHGIHAYFTTNKPTRVKFTNGTYLCKESYDVNIHKYQSLVLFAEKIAFLQTYKRQLLTQLLIQRSPVVFSVKPAGTALVYDFQEPNTHWGIVNGFVAHNCGEYSWLENSACNLASLNLDRFLLPDRSWDFKTFKHVIRLVLTAQDILIDYAGYPTEQIRENSSKYRPLGMGFTNLGGMLMSLGLAYDSDDGRNLAAAITSLMTGQAYLTSAELATVKGPFDRFETNKVPMEEVLGRHVSATRTLKKDGAGISSKALSVWREAMSTGFGKKQEDGTGFRNCQVSVIAPAGTISFVLGAATTGIEPEFGLKKTKTMVGGDVISYLNPNIEKALIALGYDDTTRGELLPYIAEHGHFEGSKLKTEHLPVFDCSMPIKNRCLSVDAHIEMVAAVQPFISGAISKTFNMKHDATVKDIQLTFLKAWERGIKGITIYRNGSKLSEPLRVAEVLKQVKKPTAHREELPDDRESFTHKFIVNGYTGYMTIGYYPDGRPGELFLRMAKPGSMVSGLLDSFATSCSFLLQYGVPLEVLVRRFESTKFSPAGITGNREIPFAESIIDYVFRWLKKRFLTSETQQEVDSHHAKKVEETTQKSPESDHMDYDLSTDPCPTCGSAMVKTGSCSVCVVCSYSSGVCS